MIAITRKLSLWVFHVIGVIICVTNLYFGWYEDYSHSSSSKELCLISSFALMLVLGYSCLLWSRERSNYGYIIVFAQIILIVILNPIFPFDEAQLKIAFILTIPVLFAAIRFRQVTLLATSGTSKITSTEKVAQAKPGVSHLPVQPGVVASGWIQWPAGPRILWNITFLVLMILFWAFFIYDTRRSLYRDDNDGLTLFMNMYLVLFISTAILKIGSMFGEKTIRYTRAIGIFVLVPLLFFGSDLLYQGTSCIITVGLVAATELTCFNTLAITEYRFFERKKSCWATIVIQIGVSLLTLFVAFIIANVALHKR